MKITILMLLAACTVSACTSYDRLSPDFGVAIRQDEAAQIANPEARYVGIPAPGSNGERAGLAQTRYQRDEVIPPVTLGAASAASVNGSGAGASAQMGAPPPPAAGQ